MLERHCMGRVWPLSLLHKIFPLFDELMTPPQALMLLLYCQILLEVHSWNRRFQCYIRLADVHFNDFGCVRISRPSFGGLQDSRRSGRRLLVDSIVVFRGACLRRLVTSCGSSLREPLH